MKKALWIVLALFFVVTIASPADARLRRKKGGDAAKKIEDSLTALETMMGNPETEIPAYIFEKAEAVAIFPGIKKIGLGIGVRQGYGLIMARQENGQWGPPAFFRLRGASTGWQAGAQEMDTILLIMDQKGLESFMGKELTLGADASIAAGPNKKTVDADTTTDLDSDLYSYTRVKRGLFAGVAVKGSRIVYNEKMTKGLYGKSLGAADIIMDGKVAMPDQAKPLAEALAEYSKGDEPEPEKKEGAKK